jgi:hypothetical protein
MVAATLEHLAVLTTGMATGQARLKAMAEDAPRALRWVEAVTGEVREAERNHYTLGRLERTIGRIERSVDVAMVKREASA